VRPGNPRFFSSQCFSELVFVLAAAKVIVFSKLPKLLSSFFILFSDPLFHLFKPCFTIAGKTLPVESGCKEISFF
jgi:hypothetical protein